MLSLKKKLLLNGSRLRPQDVFATSLYTGNGGSRSIANGLNFAGKGGLVWLKQRASDSGAGPYPHVLTDTVRGVGKILTTNNDVQESTTPGTVTAFASNGFSIGSNAAVNVSPDPFVGWGFLRARGFFGVVPYTGDGNVGRPIQHELGPGFKPGLVIVKRLDGAGDWWAAHKSISSVDGASGSNLKINSVSVGFSERIYDLALSTFRVRDEANVVNARYIAYVWADNPEVTATGSFVGTGSAPPISVQCGKGWRPQFLLTKRTTTNGDWYIRDAARNPANPRSTVLFAGNTSGEAGTALFNAEFLSTGFSITSTTSDNQANETVIYMAIREPVL